MNKELQDLAWSVLPKEFKEEVKKLYADALDASNSPHEPDDRKWGNYRVALLEKLFGHHNLTSDAEGEEMLMCNKGVVEALYLESLKCAPKLERWKGIKWTLDTLFGSKCLPDETPLSQNSPENCDNGNHISNDCDKSAEPKFKRGDKVRYVGDMQPTYKGKAFVMDGEVFFNDYYNQWQTRSIKPFAWDGLSVCNVPLTDLEPYTEPEDEVVKMKPIKSKVSVYLATKEEDKEFRMLLHENGFMWNDESSLISRSNWASEPKDYQIHFVYPDKTVTYSGERTEDTLTFTEFKKRYFGEDVNLSQETENCDKQLENILKDSFREHNRLHIAAMAMQGILSNADRMKEYERIAKAGPTYEELTAVVARNAMRYADALIRETEKTAKTSN